MEKERGKSRQANGIKLIEGKRERDFGLEEGKREANGIESKEGRKEGN